MRYASQTAVPVDRSRGEIERILTRYGADIFSYATSLEQRRAYVAFRYNGVSFRIDITMPDPEGFKKTPGGRKRRSNDDAYKAYEQAQRQIWRALALYVKATLEAVDSGIIKIESALLPFALLPDGRTMSEWAVKALPAAYKTGGEPSLLMLGDSK